MIFSSWTQEPRYGEALFLCYNTIMTIKQTLQLQTQLPFLDKQLALSFILHKDKSYLLSHDDQILNDKQLSTYKKFLSQLRKGKPIAQIIGHKEFYGLDFLVNKYTLIPRPESELLVEETLKIIKANPKIKFKLIDVGTGSGCLAITLAKQNLANLKNIWATDQSTLALKVAKINSQFHKVNRQIKFIKTNWLASVKDKVNLIIANPPYLPLDIYNQNKKILKYEPRSALVSGKTLTKSIKPYGQILRQARNKLNSPAWILFEIHPPQAPLILKLTKKIWPDAKIEVIKDLNGRKRIIEIKILNSIRQLAD